MRFIVYLWGLYQELPEDYQNHRYLRPRSFRLKLFAVTKTTVTTLGQRHLLTFMAKSSAIAEGIGYHQSFVNHILGRGCSMGWTWSYFSVLYDSYDHKDRATIGSGHTAYAGCFDHLLVLWAENSDFNRCGDLEVMSPLCLPVVPIFYMINGIVRKPVCYCCFLGMTMRPCHRHQSHLLPFPDSTWLIHYKIGLA